MDVDRVLRLLTCAKFGYVTRRSSQLCMFRRASMLSSWITSGLEPASYSVPTRQPLVHHDCGRVRINSVPFEHRKGVTVNNNKPLTTSYVRVSGIMLAAFQPFSTCIPKPNAATRWWYSLTIIFRARSSKMLDELNGMEWRMNEKKP